MIKPKANTLISLSRVSAEVIRVTLPTREIAPTESANPKTRSERDSIFGLGRTWVWVSVNEPLEKGETYAF